MGRTHDAIPDHLTTWMEEQPIFFVASAPLSAEGHVNVSPKGGDSFRVIDANTVAYLDLTGSGAETIAHTRENGRLTVMFCSFGDKPNIVRIFGQGEAVLPDHPDFPALAERFPEHAGTRSIIRLRSTEITTTCGYAVPMMELVGHRSTLDDWVDRKTPQELDEYRVQKNSISLDGLPALAD